jgi:phage terminase small subunit
MAKITPESDALRKKGATADQLQIYENAVRRYNEADDNIEQYGAVVANPRTGAPMPNPYISILRQAETTIRDIYRSIEKPKKARIKI